MISGDLWEEFKFWRIRFMGNIQIYKKGPFEDPVFPVDLKISIETVPT